MKYKVTVRHRWDPPDKGDRPSQSALVELVEADQVLPDMTEHGYLKMYRGDQLVAMFATWEYLVLLDEKDQVE
jgi:hypothetical protein